jgi:hypothetical protein
MKLMMASKGGSMTSRSSLERRKEMRRKTR